MRLLLQRVTLAEVKVCDLTVGGIRNGLLVFLGFTHSDTLADADYLLNKLLCLRIFADQEGKMNCNIRQVGGALRVVSQFTLYADWRRGRRPSFDPAAPAALAQQMYTYFLEKARA